MPRFGQFMHSYALLWPLYAQLCKLVMSRYAKIRPGINKSLSGMPRYGQIRPKGMNQFCLVISRKDKVMVSQGKIWSRHAQLCKDWVQIYQMALFIEDNFLYDLLFCSQIYVFLYLRQLQLYCYEIYQIMYDSSNDALELLSQFRQHSLAFVYFLRSLLGV